MQAARNTLSERPLEPTMNSLRVLVVEDDAVIGMLLAQMLEEMGHDVCAIEATEDDAVAGALRCKPDMMIVDVGLGDGSGVSAIEKIHLTNPVAHLFVSADILRVQALKPGTVALHKPFHEAELACAMQRALDVAAAA